MIPRYTRPEMASIWESQTRFKIWFEIEAHAADALAEIGTIPKEAAKTIWAKARDATFDAWRGSTRSSARPSTTSSPS
jgi:adenylosuccinate lyase